MGADFHGQDVNRAAEKAVLDAVSKSCLCGLTEILNIKDFDEKVIVNVILSVTKPEEIDEERIKKCLPIGRKKVVAVQGGLNIEGLYIEEFGDKNSSIEAALVCVEVGIEE